MQAGGEILQTPLAVFSDTPDEDDTMQSTESSGKLYGTFGYFSNARGYPCG